MNIREELQKQILAACQKSRVFAKVFVGTPHQLKKPVQEQIKTQYGDSYIKKADYVVFYVIPSELKPDIIRRIIDANNSLGVKPAYKEGEIAPLIFDQQDANKSYAFQIVTRDQLGSYEFLQGDDGNIGEPQGPDGDVKNEGHPLEAIAYAEENGLGPNETIIDVFTPAEKEKLSKMIKHGEFSQQEGAVLRALMSEELKLEDLAVMLGAKSKRTKGQPMSKIAARKELNRILDLVAKRSSAKIGKKIDLGKLAEYKREMRKADALKKKKAKENKRAEKQARADFWKLLKKLNIEQRKHGLPVSRYNKIWTQNTQSLDAMRDARGDHFEEA